MKLLTLPISYLLITLIFCGLIFATTLAQSTSSSWDDSYESVTFLETRQFTTREALQANLGVHTNTACAQATILIGLSQESARDCWYNSPLGKHSTYGNYFVPNGSSTVSLVGIDVQTRFIPLYGNTHLLVLRPSVDGGFSMNFYRYGAFEASIVRAEDGYQFYDITTEPDFLLRTSSGNPWLINQNTLATGFWPSNNGRFLVIANYTDGILLRLDLATYELTSFGYERNGLDYGTYAITDDGRWVAISVHGEPLSLLDAHSCRQSPARLGSELRLCSVHDYTMTLSAALPGSGGRMYHVRFTADHILELHSNEYTSAGFEKFLLYAPGTYTFGANYLALGDSYASGEGAKDYYSGTDVEKNRCHLSRVSYPFLLGRQLSLSSANSVACSGARIVNIVGPENISDNKNDPQRSNQADSQDIDPDLGNFTPGWKLQVSYVQEQNKIDIVTVSISGNDADFANFITECAKPGTCYQDDVERMSLVYKIHSQYSRLVSLYGDLRTSLAPDARIYALGYPQLMSESRDCSINSLMSHPERTLTRGLTKYLNHVIELAAQRAGVTYVDLSESLAGHRLCDTSSKAMHGLNTGVSNAHNNFISQESFHPTAFGHQLLAKTIREQTDDFTLFSPRPNPSSQTPTLFDAVSFAIVTQPIAEQYVDVLYYANILDGEVIPRGRVVTGIIGNDRYYDFLPDTPFVVQLYSEPVTLGTFTTDSTGALAYSFVIPKDTAPGFHRIRIFGTNRAGNPIELRQSIYVAASEEDWDGDGRPNISQPCVVTLTFDDGTTDDYWCDNPREPTSTTPTKTIPVDNESTSSEASAATIPASGQDGSPVANSSLRVQTKQPEVAGAFHNTFAAATERTPADPIDPKKERSVLGIILAAGTLLLVCYWYIRKRNAADEK